MKKLRSKEEIIEIINNNEMAVIYFTGLSCGACEVIKNKIENILEKFPKITAGELNGESNLEIAAEYNVFSLPVFLLFIEGKESLRIGKNVDLLALEKVIERYYNMIFM